MSLESLKIIGCGDAFGSGGRFHTCFNLRSTDTNFLVDLGASAFYNLLAKTDLNSIDLIVISHFHGDHFGGIPFFLLNSQLVLERKKPLTIIGPPGCQERVMNLSKALYGGFYEKINSFKINYLEYDSEPLEFNDLRIKALPTIHSPDSIPHCLRIDSGSSSFAFSGDSEWTPNLLEISIDADLFICECNSYDRNLPGHSNYLDLDTNLGMKNNKNVYLTHLGEDMLDPGKRGRNEIRFNLCEDNLELNFNKIL